MKRLRQILILAAATISLSNSTDAAVVSYTFAGGPISGTLGGIAFTATSFTFTAIGDTSNIETIPDWFGRTAAVIPVTASVVINTTTGPLTANLNSPTSQIAVASVDYGGNYAQSIVEYDAWIAYEGTHTTLIPSSGFSDLNTFDTFSGSLYNLTPLTTDEGTLVLELSGDTGTFTVGPVAAAPEQAPAAAPEPATAAASLLLSVAGLSLISRRNRKA